MASQPRRHPTDAEQRATTAKRVSKWRKKHRAVLNQRRRAYYYEHQEKQQTKSRAWQAANKDRARATYLKRRYGLTIEQYDALGKECAICGATVANGRTDADGRPYRLFVDHDHASKRVRGLLCFCCNLGIGYFKHDVALLQNAGDYLKRTN